MNDRPTPETDALEQKQLNEGCPQWNDMMRWVREHAALARKLEAERDEALKLFESSKRARASLSKACDSLQKELRETIRERDNLQEIIRGEWPEDQAEYLIRYAKEAAK